MSYTSTKQRKIGKMFVTIFVLIIIFALAFLFAGCATPASSTVDPAGVAATKPTEEQPAPPSPLYHAFGDVVSYPDGLSISVSEGAPFIPSASALGQVDGQQHLVFEIVVTNNTDVTFDPTMATIFLSSGSSEASNIFDTAQQVEISPMTDVLPGQSVKWLQAWSVSDPASLTMEVLASYDYDPSIFTNTQ